MLDIIDRHGNIQGAAPRKIVHGNNLLLHRVVHVLVFDHCDNLLLQKRYKGWCGEKNFQRQF
jgi:isopentenyldiphosphate isomerase